MKKAMAECDTLDKERLIHAAVSGMDQIMSYLAETKYGGRSSGTGGIGFRF